MTERPLNRDLLLENPKTGAVRPFRDGFDWILFLFSGVLGIPLFLRHLPVWGAVFVGLWVVGLVLHWLLPRNLTLSGIGAGVLRLATLARLPRPRSDVAVLRGARLASARARA